MGIVEVGFFLIIAVVLFLLFDLLKIRLTIGYLPMNLPSAIVYVPYTLIRVIVVAVIYYLFVMAPLVFGIAIPTEVQEYAPIVAGITVPFLYLGLFSLLGGRVLKGGGDVGKKLDRLFKHVETTIANESRDISIWKIIAKVMNDPNPTQKLGGLIAFFCAQVQLLEKPSNPAQFVQKCQADFGGIKNQIVSSYSGAFDQMVAYYVICAWIAWVDVEYPKSSLTSGPPSASILRKCARVC